MKKFFTNFLSRFFQFEHRITFLYLIIGCAWIALSDKMVASIAQGNNALLNQFQNYKGWFYVVVTALMLFVFLKKHLLKLRKAEDKAMQNDNLKSAFLQNISHEIRTPMNAIIGFSEVLKQEIASDDYRQEYVEIISKSSQQLLSVLDDVMDISMLESGVVQVHQEQILVNKWINEIHQAYQSKLKQNVKLNLFREKEADLFFIVSDEVKLKRVITNLLDNALKFTHRGEIKYGYNVVNESLVFFVKDTGVGISSELQNKIFERYQQAENEIVTRTGGTGLGLSICKGLVEAMGGNIKLDSAPGIGSTFTFNIPPKIKVLQFDSIDR